MTKYHIKKDGTPGVCHATKGNCPLCGESNHYSTEAEAATVAQSKLESQYGLGATEGKTRQVELASKLNNIDKEMASELDLHSELDEGVFDGWLVEKGILNEYEGETVVYAWDVSVAHDGTVQAWLTGVSGFTIDGGTGLPVVTASTRYNLYVGGQNGVLPNAGAGNGHFANFNER